MEIKTLKIEALIPDPANARKHGKRNIDAIKASIAAFGQQKPIVVSSTNVVVAGNGTLRALKELGYTEVSVVVTDLTRTQLAAFAIADNRTAEFAEWDQEVLTQLVAGLSEENFDMGSIGFDDAEIKAMLGSLTRESDFETQTSNDSPKKETAHSDDQEEPAVEGRYFENLQPVIQYNIVFDSVEQQDTWYSFQKFLKTTYPNLETQSARLTSYIQENIPNG